MVGSGTTTPASPTTRAAARRAISATPRSLTTGGLPVRTSTSARHCRPAATPSAMRLIRSGMERRSAASKVRMVPVSVTWSGITLKASPPWMAPMVTTAGCCGETSRATTVCRAVTTCAAPTTGSAERCGLPPCPPRPCTTIFSRSTAAMSGPSFTPIVPTGSSFQMWMPMTQSTPSSTPSAITACAPPSPSSAGWNTTRTDPRGARPASSRAALAAIATWPSWPHACMTLGTCEA
jgi:hypothetical protein